MFDIPKDAKIVRILNAVAAGTSVQTGTTVDMQGYDTVTAIALLGTLTATQVTSLKAQQGDQSNGSDAADLAGTKAGPMADADSNKALVCTVHQPTKRYVTFVINRATANAVIDGMIAVLYNARAAIPVTQPAASVSAVQSKVSPALGTP